MEIEVTTPAKEIRHMCTGLVADMHPELLKRALRSGLQRVARQTRAHAKTVFEERVPGLHGHSEAVGYKVHRDLSGFRVRVLKSGPKAMHVNRHGLTKPVAHFLEHGSFKTGERFTRLGLRRPKCSRGVLEGAHAMEAAMQSLPTSQIETQLAADIETAAERIVRKYQ